MTDSEQQTAFWNEQFVEDEDDQQQTFELTDK